MLNGVSIYKSLQAGHISRPRGTFLIAAMFIGTALIAAAMLYDFALAQLDLDILPGGRMLLWYLGLGALLSVVAFAWRLHAVAASGLRIGAIGSLLGLLLSLYMGSVAVDQMLLYSNIGGAYGVLNLTVLQEDGDVADVDCRHNTLIVKGVGKDILSYRCPSNELAAMGKFTRTPIYPWPEYTQGKSIQLAIAINKMLNNAINVE